MIFLRGFKLLVQAFHAFFVSVLTDVLQNVARSGFTAEVSVKKDLSTVSIDVIQNVSGMGNNETAGISTFFHLLLFHAQIKAGLDFAIEQSADHFTDQMHVFRGQRRIQAHRKAAGRDSEP